MGSDWQVLRGRSGVVGRLDRLGCHRYTYRRRDFQEDRREKELIASLKQLTNRENEQCFGTSGISIVLNFQLKTGQPFVGLIWHMARREIFCS